MQMRCVHGKAEALDRRMRKTRMTRNSHPLTPLMPTGAHVLPLNGAAVPPGLASAPALPAAAKLTDNMLALMMHAMEVSGQPTVALVVPGGRLSMLNTCMLLVPGCLLLRCLLALGGQDAGPWCCDVLLFPVVITTMPPQPIRIGRLFLPWIVSLHPTHCHMHLQATSECEPHSSSLDEVQCAPNLCSHFHA